MKRLLYLATILTTFCLSSCAPKNANELRILWPFGAILILFAIACLSKAVVSALKDDKDEGHAGSEDNARSEENAHKEEFNVIDNLIQAASKPRIKTESVSIKAITETQRLALVAANPKAKRTLNLTGIVIKVVGARYRTPTAKAIYCSLNIGDPVYLRLDPDNQYDETAVKVMAKYNCIGYVPSEYSNVIYGNKWLDNFDKCYVVKPSAGDSLYGLQIVIFIKPGVEGVIG